MTSPMKDLMPPDSFHLDAAEGWLELGNEAEAQAELEQLPRKWRDHPQALELQWKIHAQAKRWDAAAAAGRDLAGAVPNEPHGWIHWAYSLHEFKRSQEAWDVLMPVADRFPKEPTLSYNLACYACQLEKVHAALEWLGKAMKLGGKKKVRSMALADPDLKPLWTEIQQL